MAKELTELQKKFLDVLFSDQCGGDLKKAKRSAGYSDNTALSEVVKGLEDEIVEAARSHLARNTAKAVISIVGVLDNPLALGNTNKLSAAKEILDRTGLVKPEKAIVDTSGGVLILPAKRKEE